MHNLSILITRPNHDKTTNYLYHWSKLVITQAIKKGIKIYDLAGNRANRETFTSYLKQNPLIIFFNGHGDENSVTGFNDEILIKLGDNEAVLKNKIAYSRSCRSAKILGHECVKNGCRAFIGYKEDFIFCISPHLSTKPLEDKVAKLFLEPSNLIVVALLKGKSAQEAHVRSLKLMKKNFNDLVSTSSPPKSKNYAPYLWHNIKHQVVISNKL